MAKIFQLKERGTNEKIYPITVKEAVGLGNVDNTSDADKPISTAQATKFTEIDNKVNQHLQNVTSGLNHIPSGGKDKQILTWQADGKAYWETLSNIVPGIDNLVNITYSELKSLRDQSKLIPSRWYRITDFVTTVANDPGAQSAGHPFDIIVLASDKNRLQEECYAIQHEGDTYFDNCNLAAWKIWYCLDNDNTKYMWADTVNGKGVIYRMIDEWQNDCPYDFKNIMFSRTATAGDLNIDGAYYTFSWVNEANEVEDASIVGQTLTNDEGAVNGVHDNLISVSDAYSLGIIKNTMALALNGNVFVSEYTFEGGMFYGIYGNHFAINCYNNTFGNDCNSNSFGDGCYDNSFGDGCNNNTFGDGCNRNTFGTECERNTFGNYFQHNALGSYIRYIKIPTERIYYTQILNGTKGTYNNKLTIAFTPETTYSQFAGFTSSGAIKIYNPADLNVIAE